MNITKKDRNVQEFEHSNTYSIQKMNPLKNEFFYSIANYTSFFKGFI